MVMYLINKNVSQGLGVVVGDTERRSVTETKCTNRFLPNEVSSKICNRANIKHILIFDYFQASYEQDRRLQ
jgi:cAMP phosphodiesterase